MRHTIAATAIAAALTLCVAASGAAQQATTTHAMHATTTTHAHTAAATHHATATTRHGRVSEARARRTALAAVAHGRVRSHSLTHENGKLVYSYIIVVPGQGGAEKVTVDASTGAIITNQHQAPAVHHTRHTTTHHKG